MIADALEPGAIVAGRYRIEERLGSGATGSVYRATQLALSREVALKVLHARFAGDARARARFEREARVATALAHESAVGIYDFGESTETGLVFIAMELLRGRTLRAHADAAPLALADVLDVARQIAEVLAAAHRLPLVHRDLKPDNVFLEPDANEENVARSGPRAPASASARTGARVRVVDFGLAFIAGSEREGRMTAHGVVTGTPEYVSPEQARGGEVGPPTDVYALGCMLFELLGGVVPFTGSEMEVLTKQMFTPPPRLLVSEHLAPIPTSLEQLVRAMLEKRPDDRPTAEVVAGFLGSLDTDARERARHDTFLLGRASRMVSEPIAAPHAERAPADPAELHLAIRGTVGADLLVALAANGVVAFVIDERAEPAERVEPTAADEDDAAAARAAPIAAGALVYAPAATVEEVRALAAHGAKILTDTAPTDMERIAALLSAGASEVLPRPVTSHELVRRARRIARRKARPDLA